MGRGFLICSLKCISIQEEKMDMFRALKEMKQVAKISNFYQERIKGPIDFVFFVCPARKGRSFKLSRNRTYFLADYKATNGIGSTALRRARRVNEFLGDFKTLGVAYTIQCIFAAADALICSPVFHEIPQCPVEIGGIPAVSNFSPVLENMPIFGRLYRERPWTGIPAAVLEKERERLLEILPSGCPSNVKEDFIERVWAGFALDGVILRNGTFGQNPVILGVESPEVLVFQNSALERTDWIPTMQIR